MNSTRLPMIVTLTSFKGGVGKTTTALHLAAYLQTKAPALLVDGDLNRSALDWAARGSLPFKVVDEKQGVRFARDYEHIVIDTTHSRRPQNSSTALCCKWSRLCIRFRRITASYLRSPHLLRVKLGINPGQPSKK
jgi:hypothetical protein